MFYLKVPLASGISIQAEIHSDNVITRCHCCREEMPVDLAAVFADGEEYAKMSKAQRDAAKDHGGFVAGVLMGGRRKIDTVEVRSMLALDGDRIDAAFLAGYESLCPYPRSYPKDALCRHSPCA